MQATTQTDTTTSVSREEGSGLGQCEEAGRLEARQSTGFGGAFEAGQELSRSAADVLLHPRLSLSQSHRIAHPPHPCLCPLPVPACPPCREGCPAGVRLRQPLDRQH